jgi:ribosomal protein L19E
MTRTISKARTKRELIITAWDDLGRGMVGASELRKIQSVIRDQFGAGAVESPAAIARVLADEGAALRHPEVIEFDARWREAEIKSNAGRFAGFDDGPGGKPLRLKQAEALIKRLERIRDRSEETGDKAALQRARATAVKAREAAESLAKNRTLDQVIRAEQTEIVEWLAVWIQTPKLFTEWLELRRRSADFREKFSAENS